MAHVDVEKIASLAYLELGPEQRSKFQAQFDNILEYVGKLDQVKMTPEQTAEMGAFHILSKFYEVMKLDPSITLRTENEGQEINQVLTTNEEALASAPKTGGLPGQLLYEVPSIIER